MSQMNTHTTHPPHSHVKTAPPIEDQYSSSSSP